jgi:nicotinate-nucleotide adenylyltransferase
MLPRQIPLSFVGERIGLMGGSFNPPHQGHLQSAKAALARLRLDRLWWLVSPGNPLKEKQQLATLDARVAACHTLTNDHPRIIVTAFEADLTSPYTADTVDHLTRRRPGTHFVWVMGADSLATFHRWKRWQDIFASVPIAVVDRPGWRLKAIASPAAQRFRAALVPDRQAGQIAVRDAPAWAYLTVPQNPLSSTELRSAKPQTTD